MDKTPENNTDTEINSVPALEFLEKEGFFSVSTKGVSMMPMLRDGIDTVIINRKEDRLQKYDVAFFRRGKSLVLHRVIKVLPEGYIIRGDNCIGYDKVAEDDVLGVLTLFVRGKKQISVLDSSYRIYSRLIVFFYPVKKAVFRVRKTAVKILKKLGIK